LVGGALALDRLVINVRDLDRVDVVQLGFQLPSRPAAHNMTSLERNTFKSAVKLAGFVDSRLAVFREVLAAADNRPPGATVVPTTRYPIARLPFPLPPSPGTLFSSPLTLALGASAQAYVFIGPAGEIGVYGSGTGELGWFTEIGGGFWTQIGFSAGPVVTVILGGPSDLAGVSFAVGVDVGAGPKWLSTSGLLLFSDPFDPSVPVPLRIPRFLGLAYGISFGLGLFPLPMDITVQYATTDVHPLLMFK
jgi:hypothetical protein